MTDAAAFPARPLLHWARLGVRQKIVLILLAALLVSLTANTWMWFESREQDVVSETNRLGQEVSRLVAHNLLNSIVAYNYHAVELNLRELTKNEDVAYARVLSPKGNVMAEAGSAGKDGKEKIVTFRQPIMAGTERQGELEVGISTARIVRELAAERQSAVLRQLIIIFVVLAVELVALSCLIIRPLCMISDTISQGTNSEGEIVGPIPLQSSDEFGDMANEFNNLRVRLNEANQKLRSRITLANEELQRANMQLSEQAEELTRMNRELMELSITDPLTGLYNRRQFEVLMQNEVINAIRSGEPISILLIDVDHFKSFNDRHGHDVGDAVLQHIASHIRQRIRRADIACRYGGDEFFILCRHATIASIVSIGDDIMHGVADSPLLHAGEPLAVTLSMGAATIPGTTTVGSAEDFFKCADLALFACKQRGRNGVVHYSMLRTHNHASARPEEYS